MVEIKENETGIDVVSPYDAGFVREAKALGGQWRAKDKTWHFDKARRDDVEALLKRIFPSEKPAPRRRNTTKPSISELPAHIPVRLTAKEDVRSFQGQIEFAGRKLLSIAGHRDLPVYADGVRLVSGEVDVSGSDVEAIVTAKAGTVLEVADLATKDAFNRRQWKIAAVKGKLPKVDRRSLFVERDRLEQRKYEIDDILLNDPDFKPKHQKVPEKRSVFGKPPGKLI